jgi:hypothetical protein
MKHSVTCEDLAWLEDEGFWVDPEPEVLPDGRKHYYVDGLLCSEEQIVRHLTESARLHQDSGD